MSFDLRRMIESKRAYRRWLAQRPVAEKLAMLDELRDRLLTIRTAAEGRDAARATEAVDAKTARDDEGEVGALLSHRDGRGRG